MADEPVVRDDNPHRPAYQDGAYSCAAPGCLYFLLASPGQFVERYFIAWHTLPMQEGEP